MNNKIVSLNDLWKIQYKNRDEIIKKQLKGNNLKRWNRQSRIQKMITIDRLKTKNIIK